MIHTTRQLKSKQCFHQYMCPGEKCRAVAMATELWPFLDLLPDFIFLFREEKSGGLEEGAGSGRWWERTES